MKNEEFKVGVIRFFTSFKMTFIYGSNKDCDRGVSNY